MTEEKKAIDFLKIFSKTEIDYCKLEKADVLDILNVITKQQKEIEALKNNELDYTTIYINGVYEGKKFYKDKIKEKIKQLEIVENTPVKDNSYTYKECIEYGIEELNELLDDEN